VLLESNLDEIHIQILQTISILIQNVSDSNQLCKVFGLVLVYIMSHRTMNKIIGYSYNFDNDEIVNYFIAFLKSLAVRLDDESIKFFFNEVILI